MALYYIAETALVEDELDLIESYQAAGLRIVQLCYNRKNLIEDGAGERTDAGLSHFGIKFIERLNALNLVVDCAHTGHQTSMDAVTTSASPIIITHANAYGVQDNGRIIQDELIRAIAENGGVVGTGGFPPFLSWKGQATLDQFIDDIAYEADLVGIDHVGIGIDYYQGQHPVEDDETAMKRYDGPVRTAIGAHRNTPAPIQIPTGIETPSDFRTSQRACSNARIQRIGYA